ncbi:uncharacterized protein MELLADRAFT_86486 [Melampsora larici-populina 98AG31]|uniref:Uncharacterized protein n=1 Tax=Melampsora larici-populina (strain 98AG31 / pathotype 3-4-7) TaxID=747676 RepID=F4RM03_MELLP|nr:uncharacterized protein MELLADRAFT_86486 [Melampsora larici-populina 98AG31]EGG06674.1 hypothetical protein MELLADRAFT_86486 [Melampsora larici-populina 98AG31]
MELNAGTTLTGAYQQLSCDKPNDQSRDSSWLAPKTHSSLKRISRDNKVSSCRMLYNVVDSVIGNRDAFKIKSSRKLSHLWSKFSSSKLEHPKKPVLERLHSLQEGRKVSDRLLFDSPDGPSPKTVLSGPPDEWNIVRKMFQSEPGTPTKFHWQSLLSPKKTIIWSPEVLEKAPSGQVVVEKYIDSFDAEAFTQYIADQERKTKQPQLSILKKLTEGNENTTPDQFAEMIDVLEPVLRVHNMRLFPEADNSDFFQPVFTITSDLKASIEKIILKTLKEHLELNKTFSNPEQNLWIFHRSLKNRLYEEAKGRFRYDLLSLEKVANKIFKKASDKEFFTIIDDDLQEIAERYALSILLARLPIAKGHQNLTEDKALYIRQCLGSVYAFTLKYKSLTAEPLPNAINGYYSKIYHRYSDCPELRHFAERLHQEYNSKLPESERHDITEITVDDEYIKE